MKTLSNSILLIKKLKDATEDSKKKVKHLDEMKKRNLLLKEIEESKSLAEKMFSELVTDEKLLSVAKKGVSEYPILFIDDSEKPIKNRKTGYQYNIGKLGEFLFCKLVENGFTPEIIHVREYQLENSKPNNPNWSKPFDENIVSLPGYYLGIKW